MRVVVPFDAVTPKTRLAPVLDETERDEFARAMLQDVLAALSSVSNVASVDVDVVATAPLGGGESVDTDATSVSVDVDVDERPLSAVVDDAIAETVDGTESLAVVMADLALATPAALERLFATDGAVVAVPGRSVGTNALVVREPGFRVDFHGSSFLDHQRAAAELNCSFGTVDSFRLSTDVDEPEDLVEAFVHGGPRTRSWLQSRFGLRTDEQAGRVELARE